MALKVTNPKGKRNYANDKKSSHAVSLCPSHRTSYHHWQGGGACARHDEAEETDPGAHGPGLLRWHLWLHPLQEEDEARGGEMWGTTFPQGALVRSLSCSFRAHSFKIWATTSVSMTTRNRRSLGQSEHRDAPASHTPRLSDYLTTPDLRSRKTRWDHQAHRQPWRCPIPRLFCGWSFILMHSLDFIPLGEIPFLCMSDMESEFELHCITCCVCPCSRKATRIYKKKGPKKPLQVQYMYTDSHAGHWVSRPHTQARKCLTSYPGH